MNVLAVMSGMLLGGVRDARRLVKIPIAKLHLQFWFRRCGLRACNLWPGVYAVALSGPCFENHSSSGRSVLTSEPRYDQEAQNAKSILKREGHLPQGLWWQWDSLWWQSPTDHSSKLLKYSKYVYHYENIHTPAYCLDYNIHSILSCCAELSDSEWGFIPNDP